MKKLNIYKSALAILSMSSIALFSGCTLNNVEAKESASDQVSLPANATISARVRTQATSCHHLTVYFGDQPITFKECEGYDINVYKQEKDYSCEIEYKIKKENKNVLDGVTTNYNLFEVYHEVADEIIDNESVQKVK